MQYTLLYTYMHTVSMSVLCMYEVHRVVVVCRLVVYVGTVILACTCGNSTA